MINHVYQLVAPRSIFVKYVDVPFESMPLVQPEYLAICQADQRYFQGQRDQKAIQEKLPMALIHECCGRIVRDPSKNFSVGERVVLIPNVPPPKVEGVYENYAKGSRFLSSGYDGFMRELIPIAPDRIISYSDIDPQVAAITEFVSVAVHASIRFNVIAHKTRSLIGIWGDGNLSYVLAAVLKKQFPQINIAVIGHQLKKLARFSFADETYLATSLPPDFYIDHAFECCGGEGSIYAIRDMIRYINPQGALMLLGVSENAIAVETRMVLEKGLTLVGCSRSGRHDFELASKLMKQHDFQRQLRRILNDAGVVRTAGDIYRVFDEDFSTPFKTVFRWEL